MPDPRPQPLTPEELLGVYDELNRWSIDVPLTKEIAECILGKKLAARLEVTTPVDMSKLEKSVPGAARHVN